MGPLKKCGWTVSHKVKWDRKTKNWRYQQRHLDFWPEQLEVWSCHKVSWKSYRKLSSGQGAGIISLVWPSYIWRCLLGTLAWKIPWTEEPSGLQSMGSRRVGHNWASSLSLFTFMHWRRKWQPTPVFLPGESQGRGSLVGCHLWGHTESDTTEVT